jgi:Utp14 protein
MDTEKEFARDMHTPVGREWTPALAHASLIAPRIVTRPGLGIAPITMTPEQENKYKKKAGKYLGKYHKAK